MSFNQRLALFFVISLGIFFGYAKLFPAPPVDPAATGATATTGAAAATGSTAASGATAASAGTGSAIAARGQAAPELAPETESVVEAKEARIENELMALNLSNSRRGLLSSVETLSPQFLEADGKGLDFVDLKDAASLSLGFVDGPTDFGWAKADWTFDPEASDAGKAFALVRREGGVEVRQRIEMLSEYNAKLEVTVTNLSPGAQQHQLEMRVRMGQGSEDSRYDIHRVLCKTAEDVEDFDKSDLGDTSERVNEAVRWIAADSKYFGQIVVPENGFAGCEAAMPSDARYLSIAGQLDPTRLGPRESKTYTFGMYIGAKEQDRLASFDVIKDAHLEDSIDWGWFGGLSKAIGGLMLSLLRFFYGLTGVWGVAIFLMTVVVKLITLPLTLKQYRSMRRMKEINPDIKAIKEKYGDDKAKQSQEMQALFARTGVNPLAGCLPMVVQFPVWIALYAMLGTVVELYHEPFLWLPDLTKADPLYILPVLMGGMMFLQVRMQPSAADNEQAKIMQWMMPGIFVFMMLFLPSGLGVYIFANIVLSLIQSYFQLRTPSETTPEPAKT